MTLSNVAYQTATKFEEIGFDVWFRNNEDHIAEGVISGENISIEICQKKFADDAWGYEIQLYIQSKGHMTVFKERMTEGKDADYYYAMICNKIEEKI